ncbi:conserved hypothetical protein [Ricinus communis]|uniref:Uncharacterized protein n=1 Tax=Ricinus communis TaxID=3988 RepID=B9REJ3_RICCO|nr:conserved hypothetical protein [Ricinus communis]
MERKSKAKVDTHVVDLSSQTSLSNLMNLFTTALTSHLTGFNMSIESQASIWKEMSEIIEGLMRLSSQVGKVSTKEIDDVEKKRKGKAPEVEHLVSSTKEGKQRKKIKLGMAKPRQDEEEEKDAKSTKVFKTTRQSKKA